MASQAYQPQTPNTGSRVNRHIGVGIHQAWAKRPVAMTTADRTVPWRVVDQPLAHGSFVVLRVQHPCYGQ
jgi:hypothetical protein